MVTESNASDEAPAARGPSSQFPSRPNFAALAHEAAAEPREKAGASYRLDQRARSARSRLTRAGRRPPKTAAAAAIAHQAGEASADGHAGPLFRKVKTRGAFLRPLRAQRPSGGSIASLGRLPISRISRGCVRIVPTRATRRFRNVLRRPARAPVLPNCRTSAKHLPRGRPLCGHRPPQRFRKQPVYIGFDPRALACRGSGLRWPAVSPTLPRHVGI